jgi:hypothetical protein
MTSKPQNLKFDERPFIPDIQKMRYENDKRNKLVFALCIFYIAVSISLIIYGFYNFLGMFITSLADSTKFGAGILYMVIGVAILYLSVRFLPLKKNLCKLCHGSRTYQIIGEEIIEKSAPERKYSVNTRKEILGYTTTNVKDHATRTGNVQGLPTRDKEQHQVEHAVFHRTETIYDEHKVKKLLKMKCIKCGDYNEEVVDTIERIEIDSRTQTYQ